MRGFIFIVSAGLLMLGASQAQAQGSCSAFVQIKSFDGDANEMSVEVDKREKENRFFPQPEGAPNTSKLPSRCKTSVMRAKSFPFVPTGGRMSVTQIRENFSGKMLNDTADAKFVANQLKQIVDAETTVMILLRQPPGQNDAPYTVTTVYLPITQAELDEIARLEAQAVDEE